MGEIRVNDIIYGTSFASGVTCDDNETVQEKLSNAAYIDTENEEIGDIPRGDYLYTTDIIDNLESESDTHVLSAKQGKILNEKIENGLHDVVDNLESTATDKALSANQGRVLNEKIENFEPETLTAQSISYDDTNTQMGINNVQQAIESLQQLGASGGGSSTDDDFMESVYSYTNTKTVNTYPENKLFTVLDKYKFLSIIFYETESGQIHDHIYIPVPVVARMKEKTEMIRFTLKHPTETTYIEIGSTNPEYGYTFVYHNNAPVGTTLEILGIGKTALYGE